MSENQEKDDYKKQENDIVEPTVSISNNTHNSTSTTDSQRNRKPILVLVNPHSGQGESLNVYNKRIIPFLDSHNIKHDVFITESDSRVNNYLHQIDISVLARFRSILVVSGDGLLYETVNALMNRPDWRKAMQIPIGIVPTGSGNGLAYTLIRQLQPNVKSRDEAIQICCEQAIKNETCLADLVKINFDQGPTIWSLLSIGWGLLADIDIDSEWLRFLGEFRFTIYGLLRSFTSVSYKGRLSYKTATSNLELDGELMAKLRLESNSNDKMYDDQTRQTGSNENPQDNDWVHIEDKFACLYAVHQSYVSSVTNFAPRSTLTDQLIYLTYIRGKLTICKVIEFLLAIKDGSHENLPYVRVVPVTNFKFQPLEASKIVVDGEVIPWTVSDGPITAEVVHKVLKLSWCQKEN